MFFLVIVLSILCIIGVTSFINYTGDTKKEVTGMKKLEKKLNAREDMLIYVTEDDCEPCEQIDTMIDFYENVYGLDFYRTNKEGLKKDDLKRYFDLETEAIEYPSVVYICDGMLKGIDNKILTEEYFRDYLIEYGFLDRSYLDTDYGINYDEFIKRYSSNEKQVFFFYNYGANIMTIDGKKKNKKDVNRENIREELIRLSKSHNFNYHIIFFYSEGSDRIYNTIVSSLGGRNIEVPSIVITQNSEVIDYFEPDKISHIGTFLEKNGF